jgi:tryptophan halogenase
VANAVAIGTVAGNAGDFIFGPLFHTHTALARWLELYPTQEINPYLTKQYNKITGTEYQRVLDIHGLLLSTIDSQIILPATLKHRMQLFAATGNVAFYEEDVFEKHQWVNLLMACGVWPQRCDAMLAQQSEQTITESLAIVEKNNQMLVANMPSLDALLNAIRQAA